VGLSGCSLMRQVHSQLLVMYVFDWKSSRLWISTALFLDFCGGKTVYDLVSNPGENAVCNIIHTSTE
jgi:hypothetical protein